MTRALEDLLNRNIQVSRALAQICVQPDPKYVTEQIAIRCSNSLGTSVRLITPKELRVRIPGDYSDHEQRHFIVGEVSTQSTQAIIPLRYQDCGNLGALLIELSDHDLPMDVEERTDGLFSYLGEHAGQLVATSKQLQDETLLARYDLHTGLHNKNYFLKEILPSVIRFAEENPDAPISFLMFDLNRFKGVNDRYGHKHGDSVLTEVGEIVNQSLYRTTDLASIVETKESFRRTGPANGNREEAARYGGEEFIAVLLGTNNAGAMVVAKRIYHNIHNHRFRTDQVNDKGSDVYYPYNPDHVTTSIGIATFPECVKDAQDLLGQADEVLYKAKEIQRQKEEALKTKGQVGYDSLPLPILSL